MHARGSMVVGEFDPRAGIVTLNDDPFPAQTRDAFIYKSSGMYDRYVPPGLGVDILTWIDRAWQPVDLTTPAPPAPPPKYLPGRRATRKGSKSNPGFKEL
jgi:hypothetical protein